MIFYEKAFDLFFSFVSKHFRKSFKNFSNNFVNLKLFLSKKLSQLNLVDQNNQAREQFSSSLTSASSTSLFSEFFTENSEQQSTTSNESSNMSDFAAREQSSFSKNQESIEKILDFMFSAAQRLKIANIVAVAIRSIQMQQLTSFFTIKTQSINQTEFIKKWIVDEIDFFDSNADKENSVLNVDRHVFYKNIYVFVNRLKDMITIRDENKLRTILSQCFREAALIWHSIELFDMKKDLLRQINLASWYQIMTNRFKKRIFLTLSALQNFKYDLIETQFEKNSRLFAQQIFRSIKTTNMNSIHN